MTTVFESNEAKARAIGEDRKALRARLLEARAVLKDEYRREFRRYRFDFANKRLVSENGLYSLQWVIRPRPDQPESYRNQQTSRGSVYAVEHSIAVVI